MSKKKDLIQKTIALYNQTGWKKWFSKIRFWDAPFLEIEKYVPTRGKILDLGCGEGIFANYLALGSKTRMVTGIELDRYRAQDAERGLSNVKFVKGDVLKTKLPESDCILMTHLLHHLHSEGAQITLLKKMKNSLAKKGKLIVTEVDYKPFMKYLLSWITDVFIVPILFERRLFNFNFFYRCSGEWKKILTDLGYKVKVSHSSNGKPFSHVIFVCRRNESNT